MKGTTSMEAHRALKTHLVADAFRRQMRCVTILISSLLMLFAVVPSTAMAQSLDDIDITFYGYFSPDASTVLTLGQLRPDDPTLAGEIVSPAYADDFFSGFTLFSDYEFAGSLDARYLDQIDEADEYMVFEGMLDSVDGVKPGYLMFLSTSQQVFVIFGYQDAADDLFALAQEAIEAGAAPTEYGDYSRIELADAAAADQAQASAAQATEAPRPTQPPQPQPTRTPSNTSSGSRDQSMAVWNDPYGYIGETVTVSGLVIVIAPDTDGTTYLMLADNVSGETIGFAIAYSGSVSGVSEGDRVTVTGYVMGAEDLGEGDILPLIIGTEID